MALRVGVTCGIRSVYRADIGPTHWIQLLPDAEAAEDAIEQVVGIHGANHLAEVVERQPNLQRQQLRRLVEQHDGMRAPKMAEADLDVMPASTQAWRQRRTRGVSGSLAQRFSQALDAKSGLRTRGDLLRRKVGRASGRG